MFALDGIVLGEMSCHSADSTLLTGPGRDSLQQQEPRGKSRRECPCLGRLHCYGIGTSNGSTRQLYQEPRHCQANLRISFWCWVGVFGASLSLAMRKKENGQKQKGMVRSSVVVNQPELAADGCSVKSQDRQDLTNVCHFSSFHGTNSQANA